MSPFRSLIGLYARQRKKTLGQFAVNPFQIQQTELLNLIRKAEKTHFGQKFGFNKIKTIENFQQQVPIHTYETIKPWIERQQQGESDVLWPGKIRYFAKSSGTTSDKSKFIPISRESLRKCHFKGGWDVLAVHYLNYPDTGIFSGKTLTLGGSTQINPLSKSSYFGDLSAVLINNTPFWTRWVREPKAEIALIPDFELKVKKIAESTIRKNIVAFAGVPSWNLVLIKEILTIAGKTRLEEVWPNIELFIHGGVSFVPYRETYRELITTPRMKYMETYNASEGFFALQDNPETHDMLLMLDYGVFYEFIPLNQLDNEKPQALTLSEVKLNTPYALLISTNGGLWRYLIGDVIEFTSIVPPKIIISGRTKQYINVFGEELMVHNALEALKKTCAETGTRVREFTVAPVYMGSNNKGAHQWLIEFETPPESVETFRILLDQNLQAINSDYEAKRFNNTVLEPLQLVVAREGLFYEWMKLRGKLGGQNKIPLLSNDRQYIDSLLVMNCTE